MISVISNLWELDFFLSLLFLIFFSSVNHSFPCSKNNDTLYFFSFIDIVPKIFIQTHYLSFNNGHVPKVRKKMGISKTLDQTSELSDNLANVSTIKIWD